MTEYNNDQNTPTAADGVNDTAERSDNGIKSPQSETIIGMEKTDKNAPSGAYYYIQSDEYELAKKSFTRTLLTVIAFMLQLVALLMPQGCFEYISTNISSFAYVYVWTVFVMIGISVYVIIMNFTRYKIVKRIPKERAPKNGFKKRTFFGTELYMAVIALMLVLEISFVCIHFDGWGLTAIFVCALSLAAAVFARQLSWLTLRDATLIPSDDTEQSDTITPTTDAETDETNHT